MEVDSKNNFLYLMNDSLGNLPRKLQDRIFEKLPFNYQAYIRRLKKPDLLTIMEARLIVELTSQILIETLQDDYNVSGISLLNMKPQKVFNKLHLYELHKTIMKLQYDFKTEVDREMKWSYSKFVRRRYMELSAFSGLEKSTIIYLFNKVIGLAFAQCKGSIAQLSLNKKALVKRRLI